jgi:hypothetical protein
VALYQLSYSGAFTAMNGGQGRIRTFVPRKEGQIYSLLALTTHPPVPSMYSVEQARADGGPTISRIPY